MAPEGANLLTAVEQVAAFGLPGREPRPVALLSDDDSWTAFRDSIVRQRLTGFAVAAMEAGLLQPKDHQAQELVDRQREAMVQAVELERRLIGVFEALEAAGLEPVVLKGPALAHQVYPDPAWRAFGDIDLLVATHEWRRACSVLRDLGYRRKLPEPRRGFDERFGKAAMHVGSDGSEIDLHRTLVIGPFGLWIDPEEMLSRATTFTLAGRRLRRLADTDLFLHSCVHASLGWTPPLLLPLRDVAQISWNVEVDWDLAGRMASVWKLVPVIHHAVENLQRELEVGLPDGALRLAAAKQGRLERRALRAYCGERRRRGETALLTLLAIPGLRRKAAYVLDLVVPAREFLEARTPQGERPSYRRRWAVPLRRLRRTHR
ncbi:MAG: nucleotidyltransferase family protein [Actinomycetota bacterium]